MKYIIYCRKSSESEDRQVMSLSAQKKELLDLASKLGIEIVKIYEESMSAKSPGRPIFEQAMTHARSKDINGILCWKIDRLSRNMIDTGTIMHMLQQGEIDSIKTHNGEYKTADSVYPALMEFAVANQYIRDLSENVKRGNREKLRRGDWINLAPFGYLNDKANKTIVIDKVRGPYVTKMFELYSTGLYSYKDISNLLYKEGLRTKQGKKVHGGTIHKIITKTFYHGVMESNGEFHKGNHKPLISRDIYDKCREISENKKRPRKKTKGFTLSGFLTCQECGCSITSEIKKGKYIYYHCTNGKGICTQKSNNTREEVLTEKIVKELEQLQISQKMVDIVYKAKLEMLEQEEGKYTNHALDTATSNHTSLTERKSRLVDTYTNGDIEEELYKQKLNQINNELISTEKQIEELSKNHQDPRETIELTYNLFKRSYTMAKRYLDGSKDERRIILSEVLSNCTVQDKKIVSFQYKSPYSFMRKTHKNVSFSNLLPD